MRVDDVIDLIEAELEGSEEGEPNMMKNIPSQNPDEEIARVEDDIIGNANDLDEERDEEDDYPDEYDEMGIASEMVDRTVLEQDSAYQTYFRGVMKKHGIKGIRGLSKEKRSVFFKDVSAGWRKHKVKEQYRRPVAGRSIMGGRPRTVSYKTKSGTPVKATSMAHSVLDPSKTPREKVWGTKKKSADRIGSLSPGTFKEELYQEYKKYFKFMMEECGIEDLNVLNEVEQAEFMSLVNEAFQIMSEKDFIKKWGQQELPVRTNYPEHPTAGGFPINKVQAKKSDAARKGIKYKDTFVHGFKKTKR